MSRGNWHDVRIVPVGSGYTVVCRTCPWEFTTNDRVEAAVEADLHRSPRRAE